MALYAAAYVAEPDAAASSATQAARLREAQAAVHQAAGQGLVANPQAAAAPRSGSLGRQQGQKDHGAPKYEIQQGMQVEHGFEFAAGMAPGSPPRSMSMVRRPTTPSAPIRTAGPRFDGLGGSESDDDASLSLGLPPALPCIELNQTFAENVSREEAA